LNNDNVANRESKTVEAKIPLSQFDALNSASSRAGRFRSGFRLGFSIFRSFLGSSGDISRAYCSRWHPAAIPPRENASVLSSRAA